MTTDARPVALVTGASSGIGRETALLLARTGYRVFATVRSSEGEESLRRDSEALRIEILRLDLVDSDGPARVVGEVLRRSGRLDVLVNNAGYALLGAVEDLGRDDVRRQFEVNVFGAMALAREVLPSMRAQRYGRIVNVSSLAGKVSVPLMGAYCASKFALEGFSDALRAEVKSAGIRVVIVEPGPVATNFHRLARNESHRVLEAPSVFHDRYVWIRGSGDESWAASPERVARVIAHAIRAGRPRSRYRVRMFETLEAGIVSVIPRGAIDWLTIRFMGGRAPRPTAPTGSSPRTP